MPDHVNDPADQPSVINPRHAAHEMKADGERSADTTPRSSKYLNKLIEQDHHGMKRRIGPMLGFKWFRPAAIALAGIELRRRIYERPFNVARFHLKKRRMAAVWNARLAAQ